jgi:hypothetical protein
MDLFSRLLHVSNITFGFTNSVVKFDMSMVRIVDNSSIWMDDYRGKLSRSVMGR